MYSVKERFDSAVAQALARSDTPVFVGMYGASKECIRVVRQQGGVAALNFVNSHPEEHNRYLRELAGLRGKHHEIVPDWIVSRVQREIETAHLVLAPSRFVASQLLRSGVQNNRVVVVPYGVDLRAFTPDPRREEQTERPLNCLYLGQISHRKGIPVLLDAARRCARLRVRFSLVGPLVSPEVLDRMPANVTYEGAAHPAGVPEAMRRADLFILPTLEDAFALVVLEAMASGLPVVTTQHAGSSEYIDHGQDGLVVQPGDAVALAESVRQLVEDRAIRLRIGEAARHKVRSSHSWESYGEAVFRCLSGRPTANA
jgi:glycosyltransferase involved in cell wall biosynthesis